MSQTVSLQTFLSDVKPHQVMWALQEPTSEDWVILDSINFEKTDVMPLWSTKELAQKHCCDEWAEYQPTAISLADWFEFWLADLNEDGVIVGVNWQDNDDCEEMDLAEFSLELATVEAL
ncbi:MAG: DUF2750 domain-containing protein [Psychrobium sp.]|nr:DUF2750 domain-containing protein [Psychrobium sp.]